MLTARDVDVLAYSREGELYCRPCAVAAFGEVYVARIDAGLCGAYAELQPYGRFSLIEDAVERGFDCGYEEGAEERVARFRAEHPALAAAVLADDLRVREAERRWALLLGREGCVRCGTRLVPTIAAEQRWQVRRERELGRPLAWRET